MKLTTISARTGLAASACVAALLAGQPAWAQAKDDAAAKEGATVEEVIVSASRIDRLFETPTPVLQLGSEDLTRSARSNVALALQEVPQFKDSGSPANQGGSTFPGTSPADLRGLTNGGAPRTLVLVDGRRFVGATTTFGGGDLSLLPSSMIRRADIVLDGASAAWGSGAVAGVVNLIIDDQLEGLRATIRGGISSREDNREQGADLAFGKRFAGGRGYLIVGGEYINSDGITTKFARENAGGWALVSNPNFTATNGQLPNILSGNVGIANISPGGVITTGVNAGRAFNPNGTLSPINLGRISGSNQVGGDTPSNDSFFALTAPFARYAGMGRLTYEVTDAVKATLEVRHARIYNDSFTQPPDVSRNNIRITADNAFLPAAIRNQMAAAGETAFTMGRWNADFTLGVIDFQRESTEFVAALDGSFGKGWRWSAYYTHGKLEEDTTYRNQRNIPNLNRAIDAVISPATGQPVCRVNLVAVTDPGCVPINLFGVGNVSEPAKAYVTGTGFFENTRRLDAFGVSLRGEPFELPAGAVSVAVGAEGRRDFFKSEVGALDRARVLGVVNQTPFPAEHMWTKEAFAEVLLPALRDAPFAKELNLNGAVRVTDDLSGSVWSWKVGATNQISDEFRIRAAHSRDIRSPGIAELFAPIAQTGMVNVVDPTRNNQAFLVTAFAGRSGPMKPEISDTNSFGVTYTPNFVPGLSLSADYYNVTIDGAIGTVSPQNRVLQCSRGITALCAGINRGPDGVITTIVGGIVNLTQFKTSGVDVLLNYAVPSFGLPGALRLSSNATFVNRFQTNDGLVTVNYVGMTGSQFSLATPRVRWNTTLAYTQDNFRTDVRSRFISKSKFDRNLGIQNNDRPAFVYFDWGASYELERSDGPSVLFSVRVNNVFDKQPPPESRNSSFYDVIGRFYAASIQVKY